METYQVYVDSAANLPAEVAKKYGIHVISFMNYVNGEPLVCYDETLTPEEEREKGTRYYNAVRNGAEVKTSLVNQAEFIDAFEGTLQEGTDILYISLSKNISGTYNAAKLAAEELKEEYPERSIYLVDSLNASLAQGILAIYGCEMREKGISLQEAGDTLSKMAYQMNGVFTVENLKYLAKTGRIHNATAIIGNTLNIKPLLKGNKEGYIVQFKKVRGRKKALNELVELVCRNIIHPEDQIIGIAHADAYEESCEVMRQIESRVKLRGFINTSYDYCTGSHVGPGTIALFFMAKDRELDQ